MSELQETAARIFSSAEADRAYLTGLLSRLIRMPSPSSREKEAVELVRLEMEASGPDCGR